MQVTWEKFGEGVSGIEIMLELQGVESIKVTMKGFNNMDLFIITQ